VNAAPACCVLDTLDTIAAAGVGLRLAVAARMSRSDGDGINAESDPAEAALADCDLIAWAVEVNPGYHVVTPRDEARSS